MTVNAMNALPTCTGLDPHVVAQVSNHIGFLTLNRPAGLNALTLDMVRRLTTALQRWAQDDAVYAVVLRGSGEKAFCAGGDVRALYDSYLGGHGLHEAFFTEEYALDLLLHQYRKPLLAVIDGYCLGGGMGLAQACELRVVTEHGQLGMPETAIGFFPDVGGSYFLSRIPGELGTYLGLTGQRVGAADALYCGLADWHVPRVRLAELTQRLADIRWTDTPLKDLQNLLARLGTQALPQPPLAELRPAIDHFFAQPDVAAIQQQLRQVNLGASRDWALATANLLEQRSPLALAVTLQMLRRGRHASLEACFAQETHVGKLWLEHGDFLEGVRAQLVDKDKQPHWRHSSLDELAPADWETFFEGL
ncbi:MULTISPECIES: enoyl-CoA hydratase/isomerase family protein [unclassified Pseudomonas]|uniref:enoyl-CoA hydratase/isomerase family protein n=1 Tax=unclassified Pseudomonas TaxID=196821 RepID=UPI000BC894C6|nr:MULTISPECIES: enoyl-CoA hydratase/isomerase family protein [unclassified Pseudomonas]PVZ13517.1 enoyl-CoA hydratase/carnithine racemase [Pseudomonas sp. URIL14HWK12:I12]PVZ23823.1 enoyl-CoA hydratase/carnithine racemase [Pseudomonas sp. URIL14HWK12:I10]PVZ33538.1 enoyl-CoA hydratase/carnithine racemase [Pseudomonas sp. URIL14HWK12:I11]SNZ11956.1 Enoyl-CoA hydratase/carnithine racemase [Pseudomonas sp. URIL14HWK12:I9]